MLASLFCFAGNIFPSTFVVKNINDAGSGSLREAINSANSTSEADDIVFDSLLFNTPRTITLTTGEIVISQPVKILGPTGGLVSISGNTNSRIFFLTSTAVVSLSNLNITDGRIAGFNYAGGIYNDGGQLYLSQCQVTNCRARLAGGIYNKQGILHVIKSTISGNQAIGGTSDGSYGGGIYSYGTVVIANSTIANNIAHGADGTDNAGGGVGGGIIHYSGSFTIVDSLIADNSAIGGNSSGSFYGGVGSGGGIYLGTAANTKISNTLIYNNQAVAGTSGIPSHSGFASGGGIGNDGNLELNNVTISSNSVNSTNGDIICGGGGIKNTCTSCLTITNSTIVNNAAIGVVGGGIYGYSAFRLRNSIVANNSAPSGPDIAEIVTSLGYNLVGNGSGCFGLANGVNHDRVGTTAVPIDPLLGSLANNGGFTQTYLPLAGSPAVDNGNNCVLQGCQSSALITDQRGFKRLSPLGGIVDIGSIEVGSSANTPPSVGVPDLLAGSDHGISNTDDLTNSLAPAFSVSGVSSGAVVELLRDGVPVASLYSANGGSVTLTDAPGANGTFLYSSRTIVAGAMSEPSRALSVVIDITPPAVTVNQAATQADPTDSQPIAFLMEFEGPIYDFDPGLVSLAGSTANTSMANVVVSNIAANVYSIEVSNVTSTGVVLVSFLEGGAFDAAGNPNSPSTGTDNAVNFNLVIEVNVAGKISRSSGLLKSPAELTLTDNQTGASYFARTNQLGYFHFTQVETYQLTGRTFTLAVRHKSFPLSEQSVFINDNVSTLNIVIP